MTCKKWKKFQQNAIEERCTWKSHADIGYGKTTTTESVLNESKLEQRVTVEGKENTVDVCKINDDRPSC